jgi:hypothetical protein
MITEKYMMTIRKRRKGKVPYSLVIGAYTAAHPFQWIRRGFRGIRKRRGREE